MSKRKINTVTREQMLDMLIREQQIDDRKHARGWNKYTSMIKNSKTELAR